MSSSPAMPASAPPEPDPSTPDRTERSTAPATSVPPPRTRLVVVGVAIVLALAFGLMLAPQHQRIGSATAGDPALASRVRDVAGGIDGLRSLAVAEVTPDSVTWAGVGNSGPGRTGPAPEVDTPYELGSITKTFTAALFTDAVERGEVAADDLLAEHLPELADTPAGEVTLGSLAQHRSGLPALGATAQRETPKVFLNDNPYVSTTTEQLIMDAAVAPVDPDQPPTYSNLGMSLLGTALVRATGAEDYPALVAERITRPLGMDHTTFAVTTEDVPDGAVRGHLVNGAPAPRWVGEGYLPAGSSTFTTLHDVAVWARAQLTGRAPGASALDPTADFSDNTRIGWAWFSSDISPGDGAPTRPAIWHNGITAGSTTMLVIDPDTDRAMVVLSNTATPTDTLGLALLYGTPVPGQPLVVTVSAWFTFGLAMLFSLSALLRSWRGRALLPMINSMLVAVFGLLLLWHGGPWASVGGWAYGLALAPALAAAAILALRARTVPVRPPRRAWLAWASAAVSLGLVLGVTQLW